MKPVLAALACLLGVGSSGDMGGAELVPEDPARPSAMVELGKLIRQDIQAKANAERARLAQQPAAGKPPDEETLTLPPMTVTAKKPPDLTPPPKENKLEEILRTGTIWQSKSGGVKLWLKGDKGLMLTIPF